MSQTKEAPGYSTFAPHITYDELIRSDTAARLGIKNIPGPQELENLKRLSWYLEALRSKLREKWNPKAIIIVTSGYRSPALNAAIPGSSKTSAHMRGLAADIRVPSLSSFELANFIVANCKGYDQVINEYGSWVHLGLGETAPREEKLTSYYEYGPLGFKKTVWVRGIHQV